MLVWAEMPLVQPKQVCQFGCQADCRIALTHQQTGNSRLAMADWPKSTKRDFTIRTRYQQNLTKASFTIRQCVFELFFCIRKFRNQRKLEDARRAMCFLKKFPLAQFRQSVQFQLFAESAIHHLHGLRYSGNGPGVSQQSSCQSVTSLQVANFELPTTVELANPYHGVEVFRLWHTHLSSTRLLGES